MAEPFKKCTKCGATWGSLPELLGSAEIEFVGYQAFVRDGVLGLYLFNHLACSTTLAISADAFRELHDEPVHDIPEHTSPFCLTRESGEPCPDACECGWANRVMESIESWPKAQSGGG